MDLSRPMSVITPTVDGDVLSALALTDTWFTTGRLREVIGRHSDDGIRRVLRRLVEQGVVDDQAAGNSVLYRLNRQHLAAPAVIELADLWSVLVRRLTENLSSWPVRPKLAALFGSAARGTMTRHSDIDIFLVQPARAADESWADEVRNFEDHASRWTGNDVRVLQMTEEHVREHAAEEPVLRDVVTEGVRLVGDLTWLRTLVRRRSSSSTSTAS